MSEVVVLNLNEGMAPRVIAHPVASRTQSDWASALGFSPDSKTLAIGWRCKQADGSPVVRYDLANGEPIGKLYPHKKSNIHAVIPFRDGRLVTACATGEVKLWGRDNNEIHSFVGHRGAVNGASVSADERRLATTGTHGTVRLWDIETGLEFFSLGKHSFQGMGVAFSPAGNRLASTGSNGTLRIWSAVDTPARTEVAPLPRAVE